MNLAALIDANKSVKGTRRPLAILKFCLKQDLVTSFKLVKRHALTFTLP
jgi:hypothetical protein